MVDENLPDEQREVAVAEPENETKEPRMYQVLLLNDNYTPMDFVVSVLRKFFHKTTEEATKIMLQVHYEGSGVAGIYTAEIAETKVNQVNAYSKANQHPLKSTMESL